jgi:hypothetical protein
MSKGESRSRFCLVDADGDKSKLATMGYTSYYVP